MPHTSLPWVIIGSGMAGYQLATELRKLNSEIPLVMISEDSGEVYSKPLLSTALAKGQSADQLVSQSGEDKAAALNLTLMPHTRVSGVDAAHKHLTLPDQRLHFAKLFLATGAAPIALDAPAGAVCHVNDLQDYRVFRNRLSQAKHPALILGGGLVGVEMAQDLLKAGHPVTLITRSDQLLPSLVPAEVSAPLEQALIQQGLKLIKATQVERIQAGTDAWSVQLSDGTALSADLILSALGLRPRTELAASAGLQVNRGICVDPYLQTSAPDIYALGDCAEIQGRNLMYVQPLMACAKAIAQNCLGEPAPLHLEALPILVKTPSCPIVAAPPPPGATGHWQVMDANDQGVVAHWLDDQNQLGGFALAGTAVRLKAQLTRSLPALLS